MDFYYEYLVLLSIVIMMHNEFEFVLGRELRLITLRVEHQLTSEKSRTAFLNANGLYSKFEEHQLDCQHEKTNCFLLFILSTYECSLRHMRKIAHFLMYDLEDEKLRESDRETILLLTWLVQQLSNNLHEIFAE